MNHSNKLIATFGAAIVIFLSTPARAGVAPTPDEPRQATAELIAMYGTMILHGVLAASDLRDHASANCDCLSPGDLAAVQQWLARTGVYCDWPE